MKEQAELERKLARLAKTLDHLERARREEEAPFIEEAYRKRMEEDAKLHEEQQRVAAEQHRAAWEVDVVEKRRLSRMREDADAFAAVIVSRRQEEFEELRRARERRVAERRAQHKVEREIARRKEFVRRARAAVEAKVGPGFLGVRVGGLGAIWWLPASRGRLGGRPTLAQC
jgi:translation initiation factor 3 subunit A